LGVTLFRDRARETRKPRGGSLQGAFRSEQNSKNERAWGTTSRPVLGQREQVLKIKRKAGAPWGRGSRVLEQGTAKPTNKNKVSPVGTSRDAHSSSGPGGNLGGLKILLHGVKRQGIQGFFLKAPVRGGFGTTLFQKELKHRETRVRN